MKFRSSYLALAGFAILATILFVRTTGLHIDEWNYLALADQHRTGDSSSTGKPPLFYWINYKLHNEIAPSLGPLKPITIYLFYMAVFAAALVWGARPEFEKRHGYLALVLFVLLVSPLVLLNETQLMMETASLSVVSLLFGAVLRGGEGYWKWLRLLLLSALLVALKSTGISAVALLAGAAWRNSKRIPAALAAGALAGLIGNQASLRWIVQAEHADNYGGPSEILNPAAVWERLTHVREDLYVWLFFVGMAALAGILAWSLGRRPAPLTEMRRVTDGGLLTCALGSLGLMLLMQAVSIHGFPRYNYPVLWLGLIASVLLVARHRAAILLALAALFILQSSSLWGRDLDRFRLWPSRTVLEFVESGGTILMAAPVHRLVVQQLFRDPSPCYAVESINPQETQYYLRYFAFAFPEGRVAESQSCVPSIRVWRDPVDAVGDCPIRCEESHRWSGCGYQRLVFYTVRQGLVLNQVCW